MELFFRKHLRYKQHWNKKNISMSDAIWQPLEKDTYLDGCVYAKNSLFKVFETTNFGWIVFASGTKTSDGNIPNKRIIRY